MKILQSKKAARMVTKCATLETNQQQMLANQIQAKIINIVFAKFQLNLTNSLAHTFQVQAFIIILIFVSISVSLIINVFPF